MSQVVTLSARRCWCRATRPPRLAISGALSATVLSCDHRPRTRSVEARPTRLSAHVGARASVRGGVAQRLGVGMRLGDRVREARATHHVAGLGVVRVARRPRRGARSVPGAGLAGRGARGRGHGVILILRAPMRQGPCLAQSGDRPDRECSRHRRVRARIAEGGQQGAVVDERGVAGRRIGGPGSGRPACWLACRSSATVAALRRAGGG